MLSSGFSSCRVCEAHPPPPKGARLRVNLQPGAARRAGRSQRPPAGRARSEEAGRLGHLPELQPQSRQVRLSQTRRRLVRSVPGKLWSSWNCVFVCDSGLQSPPRSDWRSTRALWTTSVWPATLKVQIQDLCSTDHMIITGRGWDVVKSNSHLLLLLWTNRSSVQYVLSGSRVSWRPQRRNPGKHQLWRFVQKLVTQFHQSVLYRCICCCLRCVRAPGENCNRGAALGALLGAGGSYSGAVVPQEWKDELRDAQEFIPDILKEMQWEWCRPRRSGGELQL